MEFVKMEASGNDFVLINGFKYDIQDYSQMARELCHRRYGVGADGILVCRDSNIADIKMIYYNSDGSMGEMCGNGIRSFSKFVYEEKLIENKFFTVETGSGIKNIDLEIESGLVKTIKVNMGKAIFDPRHIPINMDKDKVIEEEIFLDGKLIVFSSIRVGVPHSVIFINDINEIDVNDLGRKIEIHPLFPNNTNVNFIEINSPDSINIYTWERGAGRTLGCGTGACASVVIGNFLGKLSNRVEVRTEGGQLEVILGDDSGIYMVGGARKTFKGHFL